MKCHICKNELTEQYIYWKRHLSNYCKKCFSKNYWDGIDTKEIEFKEVQQ